MIKCIGLVFLCALLPGVAMAAVGDPLLNDRARQPSYSSPYGQELQVNPPRYEQPRYDRQTYEQDRPRDYPRQFEREHPRQFEREHKRTY